jgi:hypothetical protein
MSPDHPKLVDATLMAIDKLPDDAAAYEWPRTLNLANAPARSRDMGAPYRMRTAIIEPANCGLPDVKVSI